MAIKIQNLRITPYSAKDTLKVVFGDEMELIFTIPHVEGESFLCGLDNDRVVYPPSRPICAYTNTYTRDGDDVTFRLKLTTSKLRDYVSHIRKPMPVWLQVVRVVNGRYETVLLDDILALPSVIDGAMTVCEGDPLGELLDGKMDKPATEGTDGQVLTMGADGHYAWADLPEIPEQEQADWDESDSTAVSYIQNKPRIIPFPTMEPGQPLRVGMVLTSKQGGTTWADATDKRFTSGMETVNLTMEDGSMVQTSISVSRKRSGGINQFGNGGNQNHVVGTDLFLNGSTKVSMNTPSFEYNGNQLNEAGGLVEVGSDGKVPDGLLVNADWDESDSTEASFIQNKPDVYTKGETDALLDGKAGKATTLAGYGITDAYTKTEVDQKVASVYRYKGTVATYADLPSSGQEVGDVYNVETADSGHGIKAGDNVAWNGTTWDALAGEIVFPEQVQSDWDESDSSEKSFIQNKPTLFSGSYNDLTDKPHIPEDQVHANWDESDSSEVSFIQNKPSIPAPQVQSDWDESDSSDVSFILNKPVIPEQVQSDWDESDSTSPAYIQNKPEVGGSVPDTTDYLCFTAAQSSSTIRLDKYRNALEIELEYSTDKATWITYTWSENTGTTITLSDAGDTVWFRGNNNQFNSFYDRFNGFDGYRFILSGKIDASGNIMSLLDKTCNSLVIPTEYCFATLFMGTSALKSAPRLPALTLKNYCYDSMFRSSGIMQAPELPATTLAQYCYQSFLLSTTNIIAVEIPNFITAAQGAFSFFISMSSVKYIKVHFTSWTGAPDLFSNWVNMIGNCIFTCPSSLDTTYGTSSVPYNSIIVFDDAPNSDWCETDEKHANYVKNRNTSTVATSSDATYELASGLATTPVITVSSSLTLSASASASTQIAYAEVVLDIDANATVTAGTNLTLVDTPEAGKRNVCVVRWSGGVAKLYVTIVEDLPQA